MQKQMKELIPAQNHLFNFVTPCCFTVITFGSTGERPQVDAEVENTEISTVN